MALICGLIHRLTKTAAHQTHERRRRLRAPLPEART